MARADASLSRRVPSAAAPPRRCIWANARRSSIVRRPRERAKYVREVRSDRRQLAAVLERLATERGEPLPMDAERLARTIDTVAFGLLHTFMPDPRSVDEELCVGAFAALAGC
jgi:hypothetical protein